MTDSIDIASEGHVTKIQDSPFDRLTFCFLFYVSGRTFVGGARVVNGAEKKNHLIEAAPFGRLDQMWRTTV